METRKAGPGAGAREPRYGLLWTVSAALSLGTLLLIRGAEIPFPGSLIAGLALAALNAGLVLLYFMHLRSESKVFWAAAAFSFVSLMFFFLGVFPDIVAAVK